MDAEAWNERYAAAESVWSLTPNVFVAEQLADLPPGTGVDLAAGEGRNALWLAGRGWHMIAVDFSSVGLERGRARDPEADVEWVCADATTWTTSEPVDLVVVAYLQLPAEQRRAAVRAGWAALKPGGTFFWVAHDSTNLTEGTGGPQDPAVLMTAEDVLDDLAGEAFTTVVAERVPRQVLDGHGEDAGQTAWDCLVRLTKD
jgi:ubiquinone/menaquinone biosynthesis C-methylase UbiE